jgi:outer membrane protein assembly factor BamD (BamD/ComL family)/urease gamma subunit
MTCSLDRRYLLVAAAVAIAAMPLRAQSNEELARRTLESGRTFLQSRNYGEAVKDFEAVLQRYPTSSVADDALLELATYQLDVQRDLAGSLARVKELQSKYSTSDSAAMALVLEGRISLASGRTPTHVDEAIASFDRVARLFPGSPAVPAAMYFAGDAARLGGRRADAIERFNRLATQFPTSPWTSNALLGSALSLGRGGQAPRAMEQLQRIRTRFPRTREAAIALDLNTVLYRLYLRAPTQPAFQFSGRTIPAAPGKLRDDNNLLVASKTGVLGYGVKGNQTTSVAAPEPRALSFDRLGRLMTIHESGIRREGRTPVALAMPAIEGRVPQMKVTAAVMTASGELLVADDETKGIFRFDGDGRYLGEFARQDKVRDMAINELDEVAVLTDSKSVVLFGRDGKVVKQLPERGTNYQLRNPVAVAYDAFGHVYVQDRAALLVFTPEGGRLLTTFTVAEKAPGALTNAEALALDTAGRLYVFDSRTDSVQVYR